MIAQMLWPGEEEECYKKECVRWRQQPHNSNITAMSTPSILILGPIGYI
jgi:hypothetical protein